MLYTHLSMEFKRNAVDKLPRFDKSPMAAGSPQISPSEEKTKVVAFSKKFGFNAAGVAKLAYAADSKTSANGNSTTSKTYRNLPKTSFKPTTGADFSPMSRRKMGESYRKSIGDI